VNKAELIDAVSVDSGLGKSEASSAVESVFKTIESQLRQGNSVSVVGFGQFSVSDRAARTGRNPRTGEEIAIAASRAPKFKAGKQLKDAVNS
jgi:DNA-binding protein HU-beta